MNALPTRHVYYSVTTDNPFLPKEYVSQLLTDLDPKMAERMVFGKWNEISSEVIYYEYGQANRRLDQKYKIDPALPIHINFDFNIGVGKPMSCCLHQKDASGSFHFFQSIAIDGARTESMMEEIAGTGLLDYPVEYKIHGDATGWKKDTRSVRSDYDIIEKFLANYKTPKGELVRYAIEVPASNPPIRKRHNMMNALMKNANGETRLYVYSDLHERPAERRDMLDEGFRLTALKKGADYIEDDSKPFQHVTTAAGYGCYWDKIAGNRATQETIQL